MSRIPPSMRDPDFLPYRMAPAVKRLIPGRLHTPTASPLPRPLPTRQVGGSQGPVVLFEADRFVLTGTTATLRLTYEPRLNSPHIYLNGVLLDEGAGRDYTIAGPDITILAGAGAASGDLVIARYAHGGVASPSLGAYSAAVLADTPVLYWKCDESSGTILADSSGNGRDGTLNGTFSFGATPMTSDTLSALTLGGGYGHFMPTSETLSGTFTLEMWVRPASPIGAKILSSREPNEYGVDLALVGDHLHGDIGDGTGWLDTSADASHTFSLSTAYHVAWVIDGGTHTYEYFVDGASIGGGSYSSGTAMLYTSSSPVHALSLGTHYYGGGDTSQNGDYAHFAVYDYALSSGRIAAHYAAR